MRWRIERVKDGKRGLGLWYERGCTGSTYGETGSNEFLNVEALLVRWQFAARFSWKGNRYGDLGTVPTGGTADG